MENKKLRLLLPRENTCSRAVICVNLYGGRSVLGHTTGHAQYGEAGLLYCTRENKRTLNPPPEKDRRLTHPRWRPRPCAISDSVLTGVRTPRAGLRDADVPRRGALVRWGLGPVPFLTPF